MKASFPASGTRINVPGGKIPFGTWSQKTKRLERQRALPPEACCLNGCWKNQGFWPGATKFQRSCLAADPGSRKQRVISTLKVAQEKLDSHFGLQGTENREHNEMGRRKCAELGKEHHRCPGPREASYSKKELPGSKTVFRKPCPSVPAPNGMRPSPQRTPGCKGGTDQIWKGALVGNFPEPCR